MSTVEYIEFPTRKALTESVVALREEEGVLLVDVIENGRTLKVIRSGDGSDEVDLEPTPEVVDVDEPTLVPPHPAHPIATETPGAALAQEAVEETVNEDVVDPAPAEDPAPAGEAVVVEETVVEEDEDLLGEVAKPEITSDTTRDEMREINEKFGLGVDIPTAGPLQPVRDRVAAALSEKDAE